MCDPRGRGVARGKGPEMEMREVCTVSKVVFVLGT